jgi:NAD(P)-dependent dehydrogenase (short-subunit alcohol dehydrogenase family)
MWIKLVILFWVIYKVYKHFKGEKLKLDKDSVILISGCSRGLGQSTARKLMQKHNCTIINISRTDIDSLRRSLSPEQNEKLHHFECDISNEEQLSVTLVEIRRKFRIPDLIINNAAINQMGYFLEEKDNENLKQVIRTNVLGHVQLTRFFMSEYLSRLGMKPKFTEESFGVQNPQRNSSIRLKRRKMTIAFISSIVSEKPTLRFPNYSMSKAMLQSFVTNLRLEINHFNLGNMIKVVSILPGGFRSKMFEFFRSFLTVRAGTVDQISDIVVSSVHNLEKRAYAPWHLRLQTKLPDLLIPEDFDDKIQLHVNRKCMASYLTTVIKE